MGSRLDRQSDAVRKRIQTHNFSSETGEEYGASSFGGFSDYMRRKKIKLQNLDAETRANSNKPQIFRGIVCHVNGYTQPSLRDLHTLIVEHGGGFLQYLNGKTMCTHIIASGLTPKKKEDFRMYRIVKPAWIVDSVKAGKLLPWDAYRVLSDGAGQRVLGSENGTMISQAGRKTEGYRSQTEVSWYTDQIKAGNPSRLPSSGTTMQTLPNSEDIEEDFRSAPELTSSLEEDLVVTSSHGKPRNLLEIKSELAHPLSTTHVLPTTNKRNVTEDLSDSSRLDLSHADVEDGEAVCEVSSYSNGVNDSSPGDATQAATSREPDPNEVVSHAVIQKSEVLKSIDPAKFATMTAEEHNAILLSDPKIRKSTVVEPGFLEQYYRESRLHHLSTWKADLKSQLQALASEKSLSPRAKDARVKIKRLPGQRRYIMHVDFDSFFAAVSLKKYPQHREKPCVVAHGGGSGSEIASCNYPARQFGITNGMWMKRAQTLCPELFILPYDFPAYEEASRKFYAAILATDGVVQSVSIDEALVDISIQCISYGGSDGVKRSEGAVNREQHKADEIAQRLRDDVFSATGCNVSIGIGENILLAKVALRKAKPAGQFQLKTEDVLDFIGALDVKSLPGVAWSIGGKLEDLGIKLVKDIRDISKDRLIAVLGPKTGEKLWEYSRGIDRTNVGDQVTRKSVSAEVNWGVRFENQEQVDEFMYGLCDEVHKRLIKERVKGRHLTLKVMRRALDAPRDPPKHLGHGKCDTFTKSIQLRIATNDTTTIAKEAIATLKSFNITPGELRGIGVQMQKLDAIKLDSERLNESSQKRLHFKTFQPPADGDNDQVETLSVENTRDDRFTPEKPCPVQQDQSNVDLEPINPDTSHTHLNTMGTQFILPTQVDPKVIAELPNEIRDKLMRPDSRESLTRYQDNELDSAKPEIADRSRSHSAAILTTAHSHLDADILEALPADVREEVLDFRRIQRKEKGAQAVLPQSPRKMRILPSSKQTPKHRRRGGLRLGRPRLGTGSDANQTLTQSNFVAQAAVARPTRDADDVTTDTENEEIDSDVLAALPDDIRTEVLQELRRARLQRSGGIDISIHQQPRALQRSKKLAEEQNEDTVDRMVELKLANPKPVFTSRRLSTLPDLRDVVSAWCTEFSDEAPYDEDVTALCKYLREVVLDECDLHKAIAVIQWMEYVLGENNAKIPEVKQAWNLVVKRLKHDVQNAATDRNLGILDFD